MKYLAILLLAFSVAACSGTQKKETKENADSTKTQTEPTDSQLVDFSMNVLKCFSEKNYAELSKLISPEGVRFSPYAFIDKKVDRVLTPEQIKAAATSKEKLGWGSFDGSGEPIEMTTAEYFAEFVYDADFLMKGEATLNEFTQRGNTTNNIKEMYPDCDYVDFFIKGDNPEFDGMDWKAIRIILKTKDGKTLLVGVVHDEWTV